MAAAFVDSWAAGKRTFVNVRFGSKAVVRQRSAFGQKRTFGRMDSGRIADVTDRHVRVVR
jgi:hypothetical protein